MSVLDIGLYVSYILLFIAIIAAAGLPLVSALKHPKELGKSAIGVGGLVILFLIAYFISGSELNPKWQTLGVTTEFNSQMIGAGLTMFYFTLFLAIIAMIYAEISKALK